MFATFAPFCLIQSLLRLEGLKNLHFSTIHSLSLLVLILTFTSLLSLKSFMHLQICHPVLLSLYLILGSLCSFLFLFHKGLGLFACY